jgi:hypothetical protein
MKSTCHRQHAADQARTGDRQSIAETGDWQHTADQARTFGGDGLHDSRQGRVHEPGRSVKDRAGAPDRSWRPRKRGDLKPGGLVVEGTAGNTGIGLALVANARGYRTLIVIPNTQSQEKKDMLRLCGAELIEVPALPYSNPEQLPAHRAPARRGSAQDRAERRAVRRPVEQPRQPQGALRDDRPGDLAADRRQGRRLHLRGRHRRHARRRRAYLRERSPAS